MRDAVVVQLRVGPPGAEAVRFDQKERLLQLTYSDEETKVDKLELMIDNHDGAHIDSPLWRKGNLVEVSWGYPGWMSQTRELVIEKVSGRHPLKVEAHDKGTLMHRRRRCREWTNVRRSDVAVIIATENGYTGSRQFIEDTKVVMPQITQAGWTDSVMLRRMAAREGFTWFVDFDGFHFHERQVNQKPAYLLRYQDGGEIINWYPESDITADRPGRIKVSGIDPLTKREFEVVADNATVKRTVLAPILGTVGPGDGADAGDPMLDGLAVEYSVPNFGVTAEEAERWAAQIFKVISLKSVELNVSARGIPDLLAKSVVRIEQIGPTLSGNYYVKNIKHKPYPPPYTMVMKVARDGHTRVDDGTVLVAGQGNGVRSSGAVNNQGASETLMVPVTVKNPDTGASEVIYKSGGRQITV